MTRNSCRRWQETTWRRGRRGKTRPVSVRFWERVRRQDPEECWPWRSTIMRAGYGRFYLRGKGMAAHRMAFFLSGGTLQDGQVVMHSCDNRACCNPAHLRAGTPKENTQDMVRKGRYTSPQAIKTHCSHGHLYDDANTRYYAHPAGYVRRHCRACESLRRRAHNRFRNYRLDS